MEQVVQETYEKLFDLFQIDGWEIFKEDVTKTLDSTKEAVCFNEMSNDERNFKLGQLSVLRNISNYELTIRNSFESIKEAEENTDGSEDI